MSKVTIGCKGAASLKWEITQEAAEAGMTSSEYMETILENRHMSDDVKMLRFRLKESQRKLEEVLSQLEDYEQVLEVLYKRYKGETLPYYNEKGKQQARIILTKLDLLEAIISNVNKQA